MNLSRDFDVLNCHLVLEKLKAYGFSKKALNLLTNYLKNREQKVQINNNFSWERDIAVGVPQGSIYGALLFDLLINHIVFFIQNSTLSNYADDSNFFISGEDKIPQNLYFQRTLKLWITGFLNYMI